MTERSPGDPQDPNQPQRPYEQPQPEPGTPYGQYPQQGQYGQHGQYGPPGYPPPGQAAPGTNIMAILSLVFAFVFAPVGIVLGHIARKQISQSGEQGSQLATWGLVLSYIFTALYLIACCAWLGVIIWASSDNGTTY